MGRTFEFSHIARSQLGHSIESESTAKSSAPSWGVASGSGEGEGSSGGRGVGDREPSLRSMVQASMAPSPPPHMDDLPPPKMRASQSSPSGVGGVGECRWSLNHATVYNPISGLNMEDSQAVLCGAPIGSLWSTPTCDRDEK